MSASTQGSVAVRTPARGGTLAARQRREGWLMVTPAVVTIVAVKDRDHESGINEHASGHSRSRGDKPSFVR